MEVKYPALNDKYPGAQLALSYAIYKQMRAVYRAQKCNVLRRGHPWAISFDEFAALWQAHWMRRRHEGLMLCRLGDEGAYSVDNVHIVTRSVHMAQWHEKVRRHREQGTAPYSVSPSANPKSLPNRMKRFEWRAVTRALTRCSNNYPEAAAALGIKLTDLVRIATRGNPDSD